MRQLSNGCVLFKDFGRIFGLFRTWPFISSGDTDSFIRLAVSHGNLWILQCTYDSRWQALDRSSVHVFIDLMDVVFAAACTEGVQTNQREWRRHCVLALLDNSSRLNLLCWPCLRFPLSCPAR